MKISSLTSTVRDIILKMTRNHIWPHVKSIVVEESREIAFQQVVKFSGISVEDLAAMKVAVMRYVGQLLNGYRSNVKRNLILSYPGKIFAFYLYDVDNYDTHFLSQRSSGGLYETK